MVCCEIFLCCCKNISVLKAVKVSVTFIIVFVGFFTYLFFSDFTYWWTAFWSSFLLSAGFTIGITINCYLRCAAALFPIQACSRFGILMMFLSSSWMILQLGLSSFRRNERLGDSLLMDHVEDEASYRRLEVVDYILGVLHYTVLLPIFFIYVYSVLYEITYEGRQLYKRSKQRSSRGQMLHACTEFSNTIMTFVVGSVWTLTLFVYGCQWYSYARLAAKFETRNIDISRLEEFSFGRLIFYNSLCCVFIVLKKNSHLILKFRHVIIRRFFSYAMGSIKNQQDNIYIKKPIEKQVTLKEFRKAAKKNKAQPKDSEVGNTDLQGENDGIVSHLHIESEQVRFTKTKRPKPQLVPTHTLKKSKQTLDETLDSLSHYSHDSNIHTSSISEISDSDDECLDNKDKKYVDSSDEQ